MNLTLEKERKEYYFKARFIDYLLFWSVVFILITSGIFGILNTFNTIKDVTISCIKDKNSITIEQKNILFKTTKQNQLKYSETKDSKVFLNRCTRGICDYYIEIPYSNNENIMLFKSGHPNKNFVYWVSDTFNKLKNDKNLNSFQIKLDAKDQFKISFSDFNSIFVFYGPLLLIMFLPYFILIARFNKKLILVPNEDKIYIEQSNIFNKIDIKCFQVPLIKDIKVVESIIHIHLNNKKKVYIETYIKSKDEINNIVKELKTLTNVN